jgi:hypothetical protein
MTPIKGLVVAARPGAVTIKLITGLVVDAIDTLTNREFKYGERVEVAFDYTERKVRHIYKKGEVEPDEYVCPPPEEETIEWYDISDYMI